MKRHVILHPLLQFTVKDMNDATGSETTIHDEKENILMARMRYPSLSLHGIEVSITQYYVVPRVN